MNWSEKCQPEEEKGLFQRETEGELKIIGGKGNDEKGKSEKEVVITIKIKKKYYV